MRKVINITEVCSEIFAGGDAPKARMSKMPTEEYPIPIYANGEENEGLYGYTDIPRVSQPSITISARGTIGYAAIRHTPFVPIVRLITLVPNSARINIKYLYYAVQNYQFDGSGTSIPQLTVPMLKKYAFPVCSLEEQTEIVATLENVDNLIALQKQQLQKLDELVKSRFIELFGDPVTNEKQWKRLTLGDICEIGSSKRVFEKDYVSEGIPFFRTKEIVELAKGHAISTELYISKKHFEDLQRNYGSPQKGDLLISAVGTIGTIWIVNGNFDFYFKDGNLIQIKAANTFNSIYMKYLLDELIANYKKQMSTGTAYSALTIAGLKQMLVYDVPIELQNEFAAFVERTDKLKLAVKESLEKLETLKKSLMQEYFG